MYKYSVFKWAELDNFNGSVFTCPVSPVLQTVNTDEILSVCCFSVVSFLMTTLRYRDGENPLILHNNSLYTFFKKLLRSFLCCTRVNAGREKDMDQICLTTL